MPSASETRVVFFGTSSAFSAPHLEALLRAGYTVPAVVMPAPPALPSVHRARPAISLREPPRLGSGRALPIARRAEERTIVDLAAEQGIPVYEVASLVADETHAALTTLRPGVIAVACFPRRIPSDVLALPALGCLNAHPSLLPDNRGPDPLFWAFQRGDTATGATIHLMDEGFDSGPIVAQQRIPITLGMSEAALERECATIGAQLLAQAVAELAAVSARLMPQDDGRQTTYPWPSAEDYVITPERSAAWAWGFARGLARRAQPIRIVLDGGETAFTVREAIDFSTNGSLETAWQLDDDLLRLQCSPGVLRAQVFV